MKCQGCDENTSLSVYGQPVCSTCVANFCNRYQNNTKLHSNWIIIFNKFLDNLDISPDGINKLETAAEFIQKGVQ